MYNHNLSQHNPIITEITTKNKPAYHQISHFSQKIYKKRTGTKLQSFSPTNLSAGQRAIYV